MKTFSKKVLSATVSMVMTLAVCSVIPMSHASDIEIYSDSKKGKTSILLMLDTSGSMGISSLVLPNNNKYGSPGDIEPGVTLCSRDFVSEHYSNRSNTTNIFGWKYNLGEYVTVQNGTEFRTAIKREANIGGQKITYYVRGCQNTVNGKVITQYDRLSRLKEAIIPLLAGSELSSEIAIGLGQFSSKTELNIGTASNKLTDSHSGRIMVPVSKLTDAQRIALARNIAEIKSLDVFTNEDGTPNSSLKLSSNNYPNIMKAAGGTPTAHAYAEAGAYMMGMGTGSGGVNSGSVGTIYDGYMVKQKVGEDGQVYFICTVGNGGTTSALGATVKQCPSNWPEYDSQKKTATGTIIYKPRLNSAGIQDRDSTGQLIWDTVSFDDFKKYVASNSSLGGTNGVMNNLWSVYKNLPIGWRFDGWMRVDHEPMDVEPIVGTVWGYPDNIVGLVSYRTSPFLISGTQENTNGGFAYSVAAAKNGNVYIPGGSTSQCDGNGIYFLTDGAPNSTKDTMAQTIMNRTLGSTYSFARKPTNGLVSPLLQSDLFTNETGGWEYIGEYAKKLRNRTNTSNTKKNPVDMNIKTAVVGFGSSFAGISKNSENQYNCEVVRTTNPDAYNACKWGSSEYGDGGFYYAENANDIKQSIIDFVKKTEVLIDTVITGSPTIPVDSLNPTKLQKTAYYASFNPKVSSNQLWIGNLNKYNVLNGELYSADGFQRLILENGQFNKNALGYWTGGTLGQLSVGTTQIDGQLATNRKIYTNREMSGTTASSGKELQVVDVNTLFDGNLKQDTDKVYWLNALGFDIAASATDVTKDNLVNYLTGKRLGAVMHSTPVLLTQEGRISLTTNGQLETKNRKDYLMYGSTQGILHVVDANSGQEVFGFLPDEMMRTQKDAFLLKENTAGGPASFFYGIDAPWVAYTKYTTTKDGLLTVKTSDSLSGDGDDSEKLSSYQWVYGGLRMGGKSYYALDLSDIENPKMRFHINPTASDASPALKRMGQSWSKPTLGYVNWGGQKKLVMFVGGGYDAEGQVQCSTLDAAQNNKGYECPTYDQTNKVGAGVYMFDANNGDLLWWSSVDNNDSPENTPIRFTKNDDLKYSVVSQINTIDRNGDGLIDHLYFGDLAGQAFRVDINNAPTIASSTSDDELKDKFAQRVVTLFSEHVDYGLSPRFYEMPSISIHTDTRGTGEKFAAVAFSSGNRSSPLATTSVTDSNKIELERWNNANNHHNRGSDNNGDWKTGNSDYEKGYTTQPNTYIFSANDAVFVAYDNDVVDKDLYSSGYTLKTNKVTLDPLNVQYGVPRVYKNNGLAGGWKYYYSEVPGDYKGMNDLYALDGMLYVNVYDKNGQGIEANCGAGVKGDSYLYQFCLPYGKCDFYDQKVDKPNRVKLGVGILGAGFGKGYKDSEKTIGLVVNRDTAVDCSKPEYKNKPECQLFDNSMKLNQQRWYETGRVYD